MEYSLHGEWKFRLDAGNVGIEEGWQEQELGDVIRIPGILQAQGYGEEISETTPWVSGLHDKLWFYREEYKVSSGELLVPFLCQPPRHYLGRAWYQKSFVIPDENRDRTYYLKMECVKWKTCVWVDHSFAGSETALCTPHEYCLGKLDRGEHRITVCVDNSLQYPYRPDGHMVSDALGAAWNGITGEVSIREVPDVHIEELRLYPDISTRKVLAEVVLRNHTGREAQAGLQVNETIREVRVKGPLETVRIELDYGKDSSLWDEYTPVLYKVTALLDYRGIRQERTETFGFRKIEAKDGLFYINQRPAYFRGTHSGGDFPLTGYPSSEVSDWMRIFGICKSWGLNYVRFHSFCPPEAAFTAADEEGIYLQVECGMWNIFYEDSEMNEVLWEETVRIIRAYGNHPSFVMLSSGNEPGGDWLKPLQCWVERCHGLDMRRIYTAESGWHYPMEPGKIEGTDYVYFHRSGYGIQPGGTIRNSQGWHGKDYRLSVEGIKYPVISHELGQWCSYPDYEVIGKFTGYLQPGNYRIFQESAGRNGVLEQNREFAYASGKRKVQLYKEEIEANFRTPHLYGFELLDLHDYIGQGTALVGLLDPFWDEKGFIGPEEFRSFCSETVPLLRASKRVYTTGEILDCPLEFCHFGREERKQAMIFWRIRGAGEEIIHEEDLGRMDMPLEKNIAAGNLRYPLHSLPAPAEYTIEAGIRNTNILNSWSIWLYEEDSISPGEGAKVSYTCSLREALEGLARGERVIYSPLPEHHRLDSPPLAAKTVFWNSQMGPTYSRGMGLLIDPGHPALKGFPTREYQEWQWEEIIEGANGLNLRRFPAELKPIVQPIDEWNRNYRLGMLLECRVLKGRLLIVTADLDRDIKTRPAARQLRRALFAYAASDEFCPEICVSEEILRDAFFPRSIMKDYRVRLTGAGISEEEAGLMLDGDPNTFLASDRLRYPFTLEMEAEREIWLKGLLYMPRQNEREHKGDIRGCLAEAYLDGAWKVVYEGELASSFEPKEILFSEAVRTSKIRFTALYGFSGKGITIYSARREGWFGEKTDYREEEAAIAELLFLPLEIELEGEASVSKEEEIRKSGEARSATREIDY